MDYNQKNPFVSIPKFTKVVKLTGKGGNQRKNQEADCLPRRGEGKRRGAGPGPQSRVRDTGRSWCLPWVTCHLSLSGAPRHQPADLTACASGYLTPHLGPRPRCLDESRGQGPHRESIVQRKLSPLSLQCGRESGHTRGLTFLGAGLSHPQVGMVVSASRERREQARQPSGWLRAVCGGGRLSPLGWSLGPCSPRGWLVRRVGMC